MFAVILLSLPLFALASPAALYGRQVVSSVGGVAASATSSLASASGASLSAPVASASASAVPSYDFTCPSNTSLTYNIASMTYPQYTFSQAVPAFFNWTQALGNTHFLNTTGSNTTGSTRAFVAANVTYVETLTYANYSASTGLLQQIWTSGPIPNQVANFTTDFKLYTNASSGATTIQVFTNSCAYNQSAILEAYTVVLNRLLSGYSSLIGNYTAAQGTASSGSASGSASMSGMSASAVASS